MTKNKKWYSDWDIKWEPTHPENDDKLTIKLPNFPRGGRDEFVFKEGQTLSKDDIFDLARIVGIALEYVEEKAK